MFTPNILLPSWEIHYQHVTFNKAHLYSNLHIESIAWNANSDTMYIPGVLYTHARVRRASTDTHALQKHAD